MKQTDLADDFLKLGFGYMRLPLKDPADQTSFDYEVLNKMVDTFLERGFTYFDTAWMYMDYQSEIALRESLVKRHPRNSFRVASKLPTMMLKRREDMGEIFARQLEKTGVDRFDRYLIHCLTTDNYRTAREFDAFRFVSEQKKAGRIDRFGFSFHDTPELLDEILTAHPETEFVQLQINYLDWNDAAIQSRRCYEIARKHGKPVIVMEPVKGGILANVPPAAEKLFREAAPEMSPASWALRFAASLEGVEMVLSGMTTFAQLDDNTTAMRNFKPFDDREREIIAEAVRIIGAATAIPCTACQYCVETCPRKIPIPNYFALYNTEKQVLPKDFSIQKFYYGNYIRSHAKASACIACGQCESHCPQHIPIMNWLRQVAETFEK